MTRLFNLALIAVTAFGCSFSAARAADWGTLSGRFVLEGKAPAPAPIVANKDPEVCSKHMLVDESLVVGDKNGIANVVVFVRSKPSAIAPSYKDSDAAKVTLDNHNCRFDPHVSLLRTSQTLVLKNSDPVGHNTNMASIVNAAFNQLIPSMGEVEQKMPAAEPLPVSVTCNIHTWMKGFVVVRPNPYGAVSDKDGKFEIKDLPAEELEFQVWQERSGYVKKVSLDGKETDWAKGRFSRKIAAGKNDLGDIKIDIGQFK